MSSQGWVLEARQDACYLHVWAVEAGLSRIPFQYPCLCHLLTWVFSVEFSNTPNLYGRFRSLYSPYSHRFPQWPRGIRKLTFLCFLVDESKESQNWVPSLAACCIVQWFCCDTSQFYSYGQENQTNLSLQLFSHCPSCLCCGTEHTIWLRVFSFLYKWQNKELILLFSLFKNWNSASKLDLDLNSDLNSD